jgi:capsular polysaccharide transport system permease protein
MFRQHIATIEALIVRDLMVRFGRQDLGFVWAVIEPMILVTGVLGVWSLLHGTDIRGIPVLSFIITGYMPLTVWRHTTGSMTRLLHNQAVLLYHRPITHFDIVFARLFLELLATTTALLVIGFVLISIGLMAPVADWSLALLGWTLTCAYFGGMGMVIAGTTQLWEKAEKFVQPVNYFALPISGVFFMVDWLPSWAQHAVLWNPSVNCIEILRAGVIGPDIATHFDIVYVVLATIALLVLGLSFVRTSRRHIEV